MAKNPMSSMSGEPVRDLAAVGAALRASYGTDWMRQLTQNGLEQSKAIFETFLSSARSSAGTIDQQALEIRERSLALASQSLSSGFDFASRILHARNPNEVLRLQSEFLSRQAHALADQAKELGHAMALSAEEIGGHALGQVHPTADQARRKAQA